MEATVSSPEPTVTLVMSAREAADLAALVFDEGRITGGLRTAEGFRRRSQFRSERDWVYALSTALEAHNINYT